MMADRLTIANLDGEDLSTLLAIRAETSKATELLAKPKVNVHLYGYTLPERLQELKNTITLKSTF